MKFSFSVLRELRDDMLLFKALFKESSHSSKVRMSLVLYCDVVKSAG